MSQTLPTAYKTAPSSLRLKLAGYLAISSALLTLPWFLFTYSFAGKNILAAKVTEACLLVGGVVLYVYLMVTFQQLLNRRYAFRHADKVISLLIQAAVCQCAASLVGLVVPELEGAVRMYGYVIVIILGVLHMMFGIWLLQLSASLGGMHRPYCYLNIVTGFSLASILLVPLGMVTGCIGDVMLGTIFLQAAGDSSVTRLGLG